MESRVVGANVSSKPTTGLCVKPGLPIELSSGRPGRPRSVLLKDPLHANCFLSFR